MKDSTTPDPLDVQPWFFPIMARGMAIDVSSILPMPKLRTGRTQFQRKNPININTEYNNNMKQTQLRKAPTDNNINKRTPNLIRKQNKYMGSIKN